MGVCEICGKFARDPYKKCYTCNMKAKGIPVAEKVYPQKKLNAEESVEVEAPTEKPRWYSFPTSLKNADGLYENVRILSSFKITKPQGGKIFIVLEKVEPEVKPKELEVEEQAVE